jgi:hypothetical protein
MSYEAVFSGELPQPRKEIVAFEDPDPVNIPLD